MRSNLPADGSHGLLGFFTSTLACYAYCGAVHTCQHNQRVSPKGEEYADRRVLYLNVKTCMGAPELFWDPLFKIARRYHERTGANELDEEALRRIIPLGYQALEEIRRGIPPHAGPFPSGTYHLYP